MKERILAIVSCVFFLCVIATIIVDLWLYESGRWTLSDYMTFWGMRTDPVNMFTLGAFGGGSFGYVLGLLAGHWWWPNTDKG
jgi:hypothetical protein